MQIATLFGRYQGESKLIEERLAEEIVMDFEWKAMWAVKFYTHTNNR